MRKIVLTAFALFALALSVPVGGAIAGTVAESARLGDVNGHTGSAN
jgi:hypothetical protein